MPWPCYGQHSSRWCFGQVAGLCQELTDRLHGRGAAVAPARGQWNDADPALVKHYERWGLVWGKGPHRVRYSVAYDAEEAKFVLTQMVSEAKVRLLLHSWACDPLLDGRRLRGVAFQGKSGRFAILADVVIDTTGDGDLYALAGAPLEREKVFPWLWFRMGGVEDVEGSGSAETLRRLNSSWHSAHDVTCRKTIFSTSGGSSSK